MNTSPDFQADMFLEEAQKLVGAEDWGGDGFEEAYSAFIDGLNLEARLTEQGIARTRSHLRKLLSGRLGLFRDRSRIPQIADENIVAPFFLTGMGRSGTSYFNELLAADDRNRAPLHWEIWNLSPPPGSTGADKRQAIERTQAYIEDEGWQEPDVRATHNYASTNAAEDVLIHDYSFRTGTFGFFWNVPSFAGWLAQADISPTYRMERKVLQALQFGRDCKQWVLKSPIHLGQIRQVLAEFPDARFAVNHRDPVKTIGSISSMLLAHRRQFGNAYVEIGRDFVLGSMEHSAQMLEQLIELRMDPALDARFIDINYAGLTSNPLGEVERFYRHHGLELTESARNAMVAHIQGNRQGKFGHHQYDIEQFGVSAGEVRERFHDYMQHYDVDEEI